MNPVSKQPAKLTVKPYVKQTANPFPGAHNKPFNDLGYTVELTRDNSPTLRLKATEEELQASRLAESMHHSGGAALESWYIYGEVIENFFKNAVNSDGIQVCSVGLGLGYIETMWAISVIENLTSQKKNSHIDSFEIDNNLISSFVSWIKQENMLTAAVYDLAFEKLIQSKPGFSLKLKTNVQDELKKSLGNNFLTHGNLLDYTQEKKWNIICFDAFSKKFSEDIWREDFLNNFLQKHASTDCVLTTYAYTAELKRALLQNNFTILDRPGFSNKRKSTLAVRGEALIYELQTRSDHQ